MRNKIVIFLMLLALVFFIPAVARAQCFQSFDQDGKLEYTKAKALYYPKEHEITCIAVCKDVWQVQLFGPDIRQFLDFLNQLKPRHADKVKVTSFLKEGSAEQKIAPQLLLSVFYPVETCGCKDK